MTNNEYTLSSVYDDGKCVRITVVGSDGEQHLTLPCGELYEKKNDKLSHSRVAELIYRANEYGAYKKGLDLLAYGDNTKPMLTQKLISKGYDKQIAENTAARLEKDGYIRENEHCLRRAASEAEKCYGKKYISAKLYSLGFCREDIAATIERLDEEFDFTSSLEQYVRRHGLYDKLLCRDKAVRDKALSSLLRRGYSYGEIKEAISRFECEQT